MKKTPPLDTAAARGVHYRQAGGVRRYLEDESNMATRTAAAERRTTTNWDNFVDASLQLEYIRGEGYKPAQRRDNGSHTNLDFKSGISSILDEIKRQDVNASGGGFRCRLRLNPKPWKGWKELEAAGVECIDIRSAVDHARTVEAPFHPAQLQALTKPMQDGNRRLRPQDAGDCYITLGFSTTALTPEQLDEVS